MDEHIPFVISSYGDVIDQICIDVKVLGEKAKTYVSKYTYSDICPKSILQFLERRAKKAKEREALFDKKCLAALLGVILNLILPAERGNRL